MFFRITTLISAVVLVVIVAIPIVTAWAQNPQATEIIALINAARAENGLPAISEHNDLSQAARNHVRDMAQYGFVNHHGSDGLNFDERVTRTGYPWTLVAENIAAGQPTAQEVMRGWMTSPGHRKNILNEKIREIGAAYAAVTGGSTSQKYAHFWVVVFARR